MAKTVATIMGIIFIVAGLVGFVWRDPFGAHFSAAHNVIHLVSGIVSLYLGLKGSLSAAKTFGLIFGIVYLLLGVVGFLLGNPDKMRELTLIDNRLVFGTTDHIVHVLFGAIYLIGALLTKGSPQAADAT